MVSKSKLGRNSHRVFVSIAYVYQSFGVLVSGLDRKNIFY
jgi:hypothetical protein